MTFSKMGVYLRLNFQYNSNQKMLILMQKMNKVNISTIFVPIPAHAPITAHQRHFQFKICGTVNCPLKSSHPVVSDYVPSPVSNTENHQLTLC